MLRNNVKFHFLNEGVKTMRADDRHTDEDLRNEIDSACRIWYYWYAAHHNKVFHKYALNPSAIRQKEKPLFSNGHSPAVCVKT